MSPGEQIQGIARSRRERTLVCVVLTVILAVALGDQLVTLFHDRAFNLALAEGRFEDATKYPGARGEFAAAYLLQSNGDLDGALAKYAEVGELNDPGLGSALRYNLANVYLSQARKAERDGSGESDQVHLPLVELAKEGYRDVLREHPAHWPSRYNLTRALELVPDLLEISEEEDRMPERSPRAPQEARAHDRLP